MKKSPIILAYKLSFSTDRLVQLTSKTRCAERGDDGYLLCLVSGEKNTTNNRRKGRIQVYEEGRRPLKSARYWIQKHNKTKSVTQGMRNQLREGVMEG